MSKTCLNHILGQPKGLEAMLRRPKGLELEVYRLRLPKGLQP